MSPGVAMIMGILLYDTDASFVLVVLVQRCPHGVPVCEVRIENLRWVGVHGTDECGHWFCRELLCVSH
jgi:hypothetical protein